MKKTILSLALILGFSFCSNAQDFKGMVVYEAKTDMSDYKSRMASNPQITPELMSTIEASMKKMSEKTYVLNFNKETSIYKEDQKLDAPGQAQMPGAERYRMFNNMNGLGGTFFKNIKTKTYTVDKEFLDKEFLIKDTLTHIDWKVTSETKKIGGYNCFKATAVKQVNKSDFRNYRMKKEETATNSQTAQAEAPKRTNFMDQLEMPKEVTVTAWFTPEIPVSQGPENYWGLPGLILEVNDGKTMVLCSKVVLNSKDKTEIKAPTNGKEVSQKEFDEIVAKKMEERRQMMSRGNGNMMMSRMPH